MNGYAHGYINTPVIGGNMIYLYIKTHNTTGLKYFGKTTKKDVHSYQGSGKHWKKHIKKHGYDVTTEIIGCFGSEDECGEAALKFSVDENIVESDDWANLRLENGSDGAPQGNTISPETKSKISNALIGKPSPKSKYVMVESKADRSKRLSEIMIGRIWANNGVECKRITRPIPEGWVEGRLGDIGDKHIGSRNIGGENTRGKKIYNNGKRHGYYLPGTEPKEWLPGKMSGYQGGTGALRKGKTYGKKTNTETD